jgi:hypothetical protein
MQRNEFIEKHASMHHAIQIDAYVEDSMYSRFMLAEVIRAKGWSNRDVGREVHARWTKHGKPGDFPKPEAIAVKVGLLVKGDATWWLNRRKALDALAEALHCKPEDLLPRDGERRPTQIEFPEFTEVAGLLPGQEPCAIHPDGWLGTYVEAALHHGGRWWLSVPPGGGKSLAVRVLKARSAALVTSAQTLFEAARVARPDQALVVEIVDADRVSDVAALIELSKRAAPTCVLAAFDRPRIPDDDWSDGVFALHRNWREQLVAWIRSRVPARDRLDVDAILTWLETVDPIGTVFSTPGDLISIVARIYRAGIPERSFSLGDLATEWLAQGLGTDGDTWLRRFGREAIEHMVGERIRRLDLALAPLSPATWADLLPDEVLRPKSEPPTKRGKKADLAIESDAVTTNSRDAIHTLADRGVLRTASSGGLDVFPNWVRTGVERDAINRAVRAGEISNWGPWANDASRRDAVDDALDGLNPKELVRAASKLRAEDDLASIAASEALFAAFGRRFAISAWRPTGEEIATLQSLGLRQLRLLERYTTRGDDALSIPVTRRWHEFSRRRQAEWWRDTWTFCSAVPPPKSVKPDPDWWLPNWSENLRLGGEPHLSHMLGCPKNQLADDDPWVLGFLRAARAPVRASRDSQPPDDIELNLLVWVVIDGPSRGWRIGKTLAGKLGGTRVLDFVHELLRREPDGVSVAAVTEVWRALLQVEANPLQLLRALRDGHRGFFDRLTLHIPVDSFTAAFKAVDLLHTAGFTQLLLELPDRLRGPVIRAIAAQARETKSPAWDLDADVLSAFGHDQLDVMVDLVSERFAAGSAAATRVWALDPLRALDEALLALRNAATDASTWFYAAPVEHLAPMLDAIRTLEVRPAWVPRWLATVLSRAGTNSPRVFEMITFR